MAERQLHSTAQCTNLVINVGNVHDEEDIVAEIILKDPAHNINCHVASVNRYQIQARWQHKSPQNDAHLACPMCDAS